MCDKGFEILVRANNSREIIKCPFCSGFEVQKTFANFSVGGGGKKDIDCNSCANKDCSSRS